MPLWKFIFPVVGSSSTGVLDESEAPIQESEDQETGLYLFTAEEETDEYIPLHLAAYPQLLQHLEIGFSAGNYFTGEVGLRLDAGRYLKDTGPRLYLATTDSSSFDYVPILLFAIEESAYDEPAKVAGNIFTRLSVVMSGES